MGSPPWENPLRYSGPFSFGVSFMPYPPVCKASKPLDRAKGFSGFGGGEALVAQACYPSRGFIPGPCFTIRHVFPPGVHALGFDASLPSLGFTRRDREGVGVPGRWLQGVPGRELSGELFTPLGSLDLRLPSQSPSGRPPCCYTTGGDAPLFCKTPLGVRARLGCVMVSQVLCLV